jgi:hypothetical protein
MATSATAIKPGALVQSKACNRDVDSDVGMLLRGQRMERHLNGALARWVRNGIELNAYRRIVREWPA